MPEFTNDDTNKIVAIKTSSMTTGVTLTETFINTTSQTWIAAPNLTATDTAVGNGSVQTLSNKFIIPRLQTTTSSSSITINADTTDMYTVTALAAGTTFNNPTGSHLVDGKKLLIRILDNGTSRSLAWGSNFTVSSTGFALPTATTINKTSYSLFIYNVAAGKFQLVYFCDNF